MGSDVLRASALVAAVAVASLLAVAGLVGAAPKPSTAPGAPGEQAVWTPADKDGFGTSTTTGSKAWYTLNNGELTEVYYPDLGTPSVRDLQFIVSDGKTFAERETDATNQQVQLVDGRALEYRQVNTDKSGAYRITKTYVTDPARSTVLVDVTFESLTGKPYQLYVLYDPSLNNSGGDDTATSTDGKLLASDGKAASALVGNPQLGQTSSGYLGTSDGWTDLKDDYRMDWSYGSASTPGNVVQTARTTLSGLSGSQHLTLSLGFGGTTSTALSTAQDSLTGGFPKAQTDYQTGWHDYLGSLKPAPASVGSSGGLQHTTYDVSAMTLAAHEDKTYRGAYIASPTMPWVWGTGLENPSGAYHLVWSRDLYQIATALLAAGDRAGAERALTYLFERQQKSDGSFPQNSTVDGTPHWGNTQLDEVAFPLVLAWQLGRTDGTTYRDHVKPAADYIVANGPSTPQERWENQGGYSPATIASEIAGLVCAADIAKANGDQASADRYLRTADNWQRSVEKWTVTTNGPLASHPYYLRITKDGHPNVGTTYNIGDSGPNGIDQRRVVDTSYLELVRLGVKAADDPNIVQTIDVVDSTEMQDYQKVGLKVNTSNGIFWHRFNFDGYGETRAGGPWDIGYPACELTTCLKTQATIGRAWPIFAGERGEYELAAGQSGAAGRLTSVAKSGNSGYMLPEQVWDENPPSGQPGFTPGEGTFSATPLAWTHAQFVRLAWSIQANRPVEQPSIVACRYTGRCTN
ncbi:MAG TPA: glycoside hydrolase family 15 protein [Rubrobacter sp.]